MRIATLGSWPLLDPTEGRYATVGQHMLLSGDWITPHTYEDGAMIPFLGKPPLSFQATALSYALFGMNEVASRIPTLLATIFSALLTGIFATRVFSREVGILSVIILLSSGLVFFLAGFCMTDPLLMLGVTGAVVGLGLHLHEGSKRESPWAYLFFGSLGIGMLTKGPVALVLAGFPLFLWWCIRYRSGAGTLRLPWLGGVALFCIITIPWYALSEIRNPGFLYYFFVNENLLRFITPEYGDRYGSAHTRFRGFIWIMLLGAFAPWSPLLLAAPFRTKEILHRMRGDGGWLFLVMVWGLTPALFFTVARQVSFYYVLPGLPGLSICVAVLLHHFWEGHKNPLSLYLRAMTLLALLGAAGCLISGVVLHASLPSLLLGASMIGIGLIFARHPYIEDSLLVTSVKRVGISWCLLFSCVMVGFSEQLASTTSSRSLVEFLENSTMFKDETIGMVFKIPHSAHFYLERLPLPHPRLVKVAPDEAETLPMRYLISREKDVKRLSPSGSAQFREIGHIGRWVVLERTRERR